MKRFYIINTFFIFYRILYSCNIESGVYFFYNKKKLQSVVLDTIVERLFFNY